MVTRGLFVAAMGITLAKGCDGPTWDLASLHPLYADRDLVSSPALLGAWTTGTAKAGEPIWMFFPIESDSVGRPMLLALADSEEAVALADTATYSSDDDPVEESDLGSAKLAHRALLSPWVTSLEDIPLVPDSAEYRPMFLALLGRVGDHMVLDLSAAMEPKLVVSGWTERPSKLLMRFPVHWFWRLSVDGDRMQASALDQSRLSKLVDSGRVPVADLSDGLKVLSASTSELQRFLLEYGADPAAWSDPIFLYRWPLKGSPIHGSGRVPAAGVTRAVARDWGCDFSTVTKRRFSSHRAEGLLGWFRDPTDTLLHTRQGLEGEVTACDILAAFGTPAQSDSMFADLALSRAKWWYHDPMTNRTLTVTLRRSQTGWHAMEVVERGRRTLKLAPPILALHLAAAQGRRGIVRRLLVQGMDVNARDDSGRTALHVAARAGRREVAQLLLAKGADLTALDQDSMTALHLAAFHGHRDLVDLLLASGADPLQMGGRYFRRTPLTLASSGGHVDVARRLLARSVGSGAPLSYGPALNAAAQEGHLSMVRLLLDNGANPKAEPGTWTPLHAVARWGDHGAVAETLLAKGADANAIYIGGTSDSETVLHIAAEWGRLEVVKVLLAAGADVSMRTKSGKTALYLSAAHGHRDVADALIAGNADLEAKSGGGATPLLAAILGPVGNDEDRLGHYAVVELLLSKGADPNTRSNDGEIPLLEAASWGYAGIVELLLARGAKLDAATTAGHTALHLAALKAEAHVVQVLLEHGANLSARTRRGWTPLHAAAFSGDSAVVAMLLARGADVRAVDEDGFNPLHLAALRGHRPAVELLLAGGADASALTKDGRTALALAKLGPNRDNPTVVELLQSRR